MVKQKTSIDDDIKNLDAALEMLRNPNKLRRESKLSGTLLDNISPIMEENLSPKKSILYKRNILDRDNIVAQINLAKGNGYRAVSKCINFEKNQHLDTTIIFFINKIYTTEFYFWKKEQWNCKIIDIYACPEKIRNSQEIFFENNDSDLIKQVTLLCGGAPKKDKHKVFQLAAKKHRITKKMAASTLDAENAVLKQEIINLQESNKQVILYNDLVKEALNYWCPNEMNPRKNCSKIQQVNFELKQSVFALDKQIGENKIEALVNELEKGVKNLNELKLKLKNQKKLSPKYRELNASAAKVSRKRKIVAESLKLLLNRALKALLADYQKDDLQPVFSSPGCAEVNHLVTPDRKNIDEETRQRLYESESQIEYDDYDAYVDYSRTDTHSNIFGLEPIELGEQTLSSSVHSFNHEKNSQGNVGEFSLGINPIFQLALSQNLSQECSHQIIPDGNGSSEEVAKIFLEESKLVSTVMSNGFLFQYNNSQKANPSPFLKSIKDEDPIALEEDIGTVSLSEHYRDRMSRKLRF